MCACTQLQVSNDSSVDLIIIIYRLMEIASLSSNLLWSLLNYQKLQLGPGRTEQIFVYFAKKSVTSTVP